MASLVTHAATPFQLSEHFLFKLGCSSRITLNTAFQAASTNQNQHTLKFTFHSCHKHYFIQLDYPMIQQPVDQTLKMRSIFSRIKAAALTSHGSLQWGRKLNTTCSIQELKNYNSLKPFTTLTNNPTVLITPEYITIEYTNMVWSLEKSLHTMKGLELELENSQYRQIKPQLEGTQWRKDEMKFERWSQREESAPSHAEEPQKLYIPLWPL